jgi:hypothetical protein
VVDVGVDVGVGKGVVSIGVGVGVGNVVVNGVGEIVGVVSIDVGVGNVVGNVVVNDVGEIVGEIVGGESIDVDVGTPFESKNTISSIIICLGVKFAKTFEIIDNNIIMIFFIVKLVN